METLKLKSSISLALTFSTLFLIAFAVQFFLYPEWINWGLQPRETMGLRGIVFAPLLHASFAHFFSNIVPIFLLSFLILYHYRSYFLQILFLVWILAGFLVWLSARDSNHIGASGVVYGFAFYLITTGFLQKDRQSLAIALFVIFMYGSLVWGMFPNFTRLMAEKNISWESHLWGGIMGIIAGFWFRPEKIKIADDDDDDETNNQEEPYWMKIEENESKEQIEDQSQK